MVDRPLPAEQWLTARADLSGLAVTSPAGPAGTGQPGAASTSAASPHSAGTCCSQTITTSLLPYWAHRHRAGGLPAGDPSPVPTAISVFGGERVPFPKPPRELAERYFTVTEWTVHERGGHFPAVAEPRLLADTLRRALRPLRRNR